MAGPTPEPAPRVGLLDREAGEHEEEAGDGDAGPDLRLAAQHLHRNRRAGGRRVAGSAAPGLVPGDVGLLVTERLIAVVRALGAQVAGRDQDDPGCPEDEVDRA